MNLKEATRDTRGSYLSITEQQDGPPEPGHTDTSRSDSHRAALELMKLSLRFFRNSNPEAAPGDVQQTDVTLVLGWSSVKHSLQNQQSPFHLVSVRGGPSVSYCWTEAKTLSVISTPAVLLRFVEIISAL